MKHLKRMKNDTMTLKKTVYNSLSTLKEEEYKLVELRYLEKESKSWVEIGMTLGLDNATCHRIKNKIINTLTDLIYPNKANNDTF
jgi:RinA family phage transcriptional activator